MYAEELDNIIVPTLIDICKHHFHLSRLECQSRAAVYAAISLQPIAIQVQIKSDATKAIEDGLTKHRKKKLDLEGNPSPTKRRKLSGQYKDQIATGSNITPSAPQKKTANDHEPHYDQEMEANSELIYPRRNESTAS